MADEVTGTSVTPQPSATVLVLRDASNGLEVLMLERTLRSDFAGGALVFPGGKVDLADAELAPALWRGPDPAADTSHLDVEDAATALGYRVAAVRETFEEAGVLLASRSDGTAVTANDLASPSFVAARTALQDRHADVAAWHAWLADEDLVLDLNALAFWSWWVTPEGLHRRYDTRFFLAVLPAAQRDVARHDEVETTSARWATPEATLAAGRDGEATVIFPTRCNLADLTQYTTAADAIAAARSPGFAPPCTTPIAVEVDGVPMVQHPDGRPPEPI